MASKRLAFAPPTLGPGREALDRATDWLTGAQLDGVGLASCGPAGGPGAKAACVRGPVAQARCGHGEGESGALGLPTLRHEFPDRLQYHDYLPGELLPPAPGPSSLFCESSRGFGDADLARGLALLFRDLGPPHRFSELGEGVGFAASGSLALVVGRRPAAVRAPTQPPSPRFLVHFWRELGGFGAPSRCREKGAVPKAPRSFWTALLTHGSGKSVVPGAECAASQSEPASGDTWGPCWLVVKS